MSPEESQRLASKRKREHLTQGLVCMPSVPHVVRNAVYVAVHVTGDPDEGLQRRRVSPAGFHRVRAGDERLDVILIFAYQAAVGEMIRDAHCYGAGDDSVVLERFIDNVEYYTRCMDSFQESIKEHLAVFMGLLRTHKPNISDDESAFLYAYQRYLATWSLYLPLHTVVIGEAPYNRAIYQSTWAAFSYDEAKSVMYTNRSMPPSVAVLANDMHINTSLPFEDCVDIFRNSWKHISRGVVFINESVMTRDCSDVSILTQSELQRIYLTRLLLASIERGQKKIHVMSLGRCADRLANTLLSGLEHKSDVKVIRIAACHPAAVFRRIGDYDSPMTSRHVLDNAGFTKKRRW
ncbi:hypothetical protein JB92DRAFT_2144391 [Gautieria morchelliformis]|nr:hypothetical protein JB92DRAFT_2144391 [Gautieria morchelliformis]